MCSTSLQASASPFTIPTADAKNAPVLPPVLGIPTAWTPVTIKPQPTMSTRNTLPGACLRVIAPAKANIIGSVQPKAGEASLSNSSLKIVLLILISFLSFLSRFLIEFIIVDISHNSCNIYLIDISHNSCDIYLTKSVLFLVEDIPLSKIPCFYIVLNLFHALPTNA